MNAPFIVEFAGPPKSGKTTILERVKYLLPYSLTIRNEVSFNSPVEKKKPLKYLEWSANELINRIITDEETSKKQVVIIDCGIASQLALLDAFERGGRVSDSEKHLSELIRKHLLANLPREHLIVYVRIPFEEEAARIKNYKFPKGSIMNEPFLKIFNESYERVIRELSENSLINILKVEGTEDPEENAQIVNSEIVKILRNFKRRSNYEV
ncbi:MAG: deoxynucleoside kinase [Candidatus Woesearchaeota archaeon]